MALFGASIFQAGAQIPFNTKDSVDINNINAAVLVQGDMFWDPALEVAQCGFPKGTGKNCNFVSAIWMAGYDAGNNLHVAAQTYRQTGNDYWPGPLDAADTLTYHTSHDWAKIWKVNRTDIQYFQSLSTHTTANTPAAILTWPAKGNTNARGNGGIILHITGDMAPFVDLNGNGIYEPLLGDYPDIKGDQALWWVYSDNGPVHSQTNGRPLGVETHVMAYAYHRNSLIDDVVYFEYTLINKSPNTYHNFRFSLFDDVDLGYFLDDFIGFDSSWRMGICYNGTKDDGLSGGHPINSYGTNPPQVAMTMIVLPGDVGSSFIPAGSFVPFFNDLSVSGNPGVDTEYNNYMRARYRNGDHFKDNHGIDVNYMYTGDPSISTQWSECALNNNPSDRRFVLSSNDFTLNAGGTEKIVLGLLVADSAGGCGATSFDHIRTVADTAWGNYYSPPPPLPPNTVKDPQDGKIAIYPNPAKDWLFVENKGTITGDVSITVCNTLGQVVSFATGITAAKYEADISGLPTGVYYVLYRTATAQIAATFVKE